MGRGMTLRRWRRGATLALALLILAPAAGPAQPVEGVYDFQLTYRGTCSGFSGGQLRFSSDQVELYALEGGSLQFVSTGRVFPDGRFEIDASNAGLHIGGRVESGAVTADVEYGLGGGSNCLGRLTGTPVASGAPTTVAPTTTVSEAEEFDPASDSPLSNGEILGLLRRSGLSQSEIDAVLQQGRGSGAPATDPATVALRYVRLLGAMADLGQGQDERTFPTMHALSAADGPIARLAPSLLRGPPGAAQAFNRLVRLAITMDL